MKFQKGTKYIVIGKSGIFNCQIIDIWANEDFDVYVSFAVNGDKGTRSIESFKRVLQGKKIVPFDSLVTMKDVLFSQLMISQLIDGFAGSVNFDIDGYASIRTTEKILTMLNVDYSINYYDDGKSANFTLNV